MTPPGRLAPPRHAPGRPIFLDRASYRQKRLRDALRLLPVAGAILFAVPLLWPRGMPTSGALIYLFAVWTLLIALAFVLSRALRLEGRPAPDGAPPDAPPAAPAPADPER